MRDVECIVSHLKSKAKVSSICTQELHAQARLMIAQVSLVVAWARLPPSCQQRSSLVSQSHEVSEQAHASLDIKTLILDSPFSDLAKLAEEVVCVEVRLPSLYSASPVTDESAENDALSRRLAWT